MLFDDAAGPLPTLEDISDVPRARKNGIAYPPPHFPPVSAQEVRSFYRLFLAAEPVAGILAGMSADISLRILSILDRVCR